MYLKKVRNRDLKDIQPVLNYKPLTTMERFVFTSSPRPVPPKALIMEAKSRQTLAAVDLKLPLMDLASR